MSLHLALGLASALSSVAIPVGNWAMGPDDSHAGAGIVATAEGVVYFVDRARDVVWKLEDGALDSVVVGRRTRSLQLAVDGKLMGISRSREGAEAWVVDGAGRVQTVARGSGLGLALDGKGQLYGWSERPRTDGIRVWRVAGGRSFELAAGPPGHRDGTGEEVRFFPIGAMLVANDGSVLFTSGAAVRRVTPDGRVSTVASGSQLLKPRLALLRRLVGAVRGHLAGLAADARGTLYVANPERDVVARVRGGQATSFYRSPRGWHPVGVAASGDRVYVLEYGRGLRVSTVDASGVARPLVQLPGTV